MDISKCETCIEDCPQAQGRHEAATGRMYAMRELAKCAPYWDALFGENDKPKITPDRLREMMEADRDGRVVILPVKVGGMVYRVITTRDCPPLLSEIEIKTVEQAASLIGHMGKHLLISYYHTLEAAKAALKGEGDCS